MENKNRYLFGLFGVLLLLFTAAAPLNAQRFCDEDYEVRYGDRLVDIAEWCDSSVADLMAANPQILDPDVIYPGQDLTIPDDDITPIDEDVIIRPDHGVSGSQVQVIARDFPPNTEVQIGVGSNSDAYEVIDNGETNSRGNLVTEVTIPEEADNNEDWVVVVETRINDETYLAVSNAFDVVEGRYVVRPGDTLFNISRRFGISLGSILDANDQINDPSLIYSGQVLALPTDSNNGNRWGRTDWAGDWQIWQANEEGVLTRFFMDIEVDGNKITGGYDAPGDTYVNVTGDIGPNQHYASGTWEYADGSAGGEFSWRLSATGSQFVGNYDDGEGAWCGSRADVSRPPVCLGP